MNRPFANVGDVVDIYGPMTLEEQARVGTLLPLLSDALREEALKVNKNLDEMAGKSESYRALLKMVTCDIVKRVLRQSFEGEPMSQESQSAIGYSWSGTHAIPGGGAAQAIMRNDLKRLGLMRPRYGGVEIWG